MSSWLRISKEDQAMYLVGTAVNGRAHERGLDEVEDDGLAGILERARFWLKERMLHGRRHGETRQMSVVESIQLGPRQRLVLLKCGAERFLVGTGVDGVQSIVRVASEANPSPVVSGLSEGWV